MSIRVYCAQRTERKKTKSVFSKEENFSQKRKVELMNNTRGYICITSTTNRDRSSDNVVRKIRKTFRWNNKKKKKKKQKRREEL
jgi:hypothetical protein